MPGEAEQHIEDEDKHSGHQDLILAQRLKVAREIAAEMSIAYSDSLERDAGVEFRSPRLQSASQRSS